MNLKELPKIELHLHLDCSLSYEVVQKLNPSISLGRYQKSFIAPAKCIDLSDYLTRAQKGIDLMQTSKQLQMVTHDLFRQLKDDNVIYAEVRFAPFEHLKNGLSPINVVQTVLEAADTCVQNTGIEVNLILCTLRHYSRDQSMATVKLIHQFAGTRVSGFDIASDEAHYSIDNHIEAFRFARDHGIPCTAHAGEAKGPGSVRETLEYLRPTRIGHGVRSVEDPELLRILKKRDIHLEICPTSNIQTNVYQSMPDHPLDKIYRAGISMSVNTDTRTISNVTLTSEYERLKKEFMWTQDDFMKCNLEAIKHSFATEELKTKLTKKIVEASRA